MFLFRKEKEFNPLMGTLLKSDIHSHLIPGVDDGVKSLDESLHLIRELVDLGYKKLIITPHIHSEFYPNSAEGLKTSFLSLQKEVLNQNIPVDLELAAEYFLDENFEKSLERDEILSFGNHWVLIETSMHSAFMDLTRLIFKIKLKGFQPVLAHPERYRYIPDLNWILKLRENGCLLQINILSLVGSYGNRAKNLSWKMLENGMVDFLGTDIHREKSISSLRVFPTDKKFQALIAQNPIKNYQI